MSQQYRYVYIVLTDTGTLLSRIIRMYTRHDLNHSSIVMDPDFKEVYSFGRKDENNPFSGGFVKENVRGSLFEYANCAVYRCKLKASEYDKVKTIIKRFERRSDRFRYNFLGLIGVMLNKPIQRSCTYFCSQFVASVFERAGRPLVQKCAALTKPSDLEWSDELELIYRGSLQMYLNERHFEEASESYVIPSAI